MACTSTAGRDDDDKHTTPPGAARTSRTPLNRVYIITSHLASPISPRFTAIMASEDSAAPVVVDDCRGVLLVYSDGAVVRRDGPGFATPVRDDGTVEWKDAEFDAPRGLGLRLYRPRQRNQLLPAADFTRVFISGDSAGGTIAHHLAVRFGSAAGRSELGNVRVRGYVQLMPFFGGTERTRSEAECPDDAFLNRPLNDRYWRLSLPPGATVDHPASNPFGPDSPALEAVELAPTLVVVGGRDILRDRAVDYAARLRAMGKPVGVREFEGQQHGFFTIDPWSDASAELMRALKRFIHTDGRFD
ncbi:unnamed protein product [Triticum turgidum subsp. durum]|uniref:Alpha/beta hydrolase fold-3 domain-containing protein n=1 Tax=Triticum turgidum subsp. durum TaxID=4567 RepID=A0A9R1PNT3_TRITD|nr:unnamed protein product [Triticum turgidum subsp. durum]